MKLRSKKRHPIDPGDNVSRRGSSTLEACIIMPAVIAVLLFFICLLKTVIALSCLDKAMIKTARLLSEYGILYHEYGLKELENKALAKIGSFLNDKTGSSEGSDVLFRFAGLRECATTLDDVLYTQMSRTICLHYLEKDPLIKDGYIKLYKLSFNGSVFYDAGDDIELYASAIVFGRVRIGTSIKTRAWIRGNDPLLSIDESGTTVWDLTNFARGKILRTIFGGDLPYDYPVLSAFDTATGAATVIKSLDFTAPYYATGKNMEKEIKEMINKLDKFDTSDGYTLRDDYPVIKRGMITSKKLLLIMPLNELNDRQAEVIRNIVVYAGTKGINLETVLYQKSSRFSKDEAEDTSQE